MEVHKVCLKYFNIQWQSPDVFETMTINFRYSKIISTLLLKQRAKNKRNLVTRVCELKCDALVEDV